MAKSPHGEPLDWDLVASDDADYSRRRRYLLCRCGQSNSKPFCDDTHQAIDFDGRLTASREDGQRNLAEGDGISVYDDPALCAHAGFCNTRYTNVWEMMDRTSDPEVRERARRMIVNCPSGKLMFGPGNEDMEPQYEPSIATVKDGPLWIRGDIPVETEEGERFQRLNRMALCRCGLSANKPYCDGAHDAAEFRDD